MKNFVLSEPITAVSVPYVTGLMATVLAAPPSHHIQYVCLISSALVAACFALCASRRSGGPAVTLLYVTAGVMSGAGALSWGGPGVHTAGPAMESFAGYIRSLPLRDGTSALLTALLTGDRRFLPRGVIADFRTAGAAHILALSGLHLGVIASVLRRILSVAGNSRPAAALRSVAVVTCAGAYAFLCGAGASIVRAFLFLTFREIASHCHGRRFSGTALLSLSAAVQLCADPLAAGDLSFQMSYLSVASLIVVNPHLESFFPGRGPMHRAWASLSASLSCQAFTAPLVAAKFGTLPHYFLLTNLIGIPLTELLIPAGLIATALSAAGICPGFLYRICDLLASALSSSLHTIASMQLT